jgi:hypothetical protein
VSLLLGNHEQFYGRAHLVVGWTKPDMPLHVPEWRDLERTPDREWEETKNIWRVE